MGIAHPTSATSKQNPPTPLGSIEYYAIRDRSNKYANNNRLKFLLSLSLSGGDCRPYVFQDIIRFYCRLIGRIMFKYFLIVIVFLSQNLRPAISREVSPRLLQLAESKEKICNDNEEPYYCYLFKAIVDIDSGYLRVWATDKLGKDYVVGQLSKGETIYVRQVFKYKGVWRAQLSVLRDGCMVLSCSGSVDLRYLR